MPQGTPPAGFNVFVLQGLTGRDFLTVAHAAIAFFLVLLLAPPDLATRLPRQMMRMQ